MQFREFLEIDKIIQQGFVYVTRSENFSMNLGNTSFYKGTYYYLGKEGDLKLPLGKYLVAHNKVDACSKLGLDKNFILKHAYYFQDTPKSLRTQNSQELFLKKFNTGSISHGLYDQFDSILGQLAKYFNYDVVILLKEPNGSFYGTEVIDISSVKRGLSPKDIIENLD